LPTADLHVNGTVRLQGLPIGTGNILVVDANGNVSRSNATARPGAGTEDVLELKNEIEELKKQLESLRSVINSMKGGVMSLSEIKSEAVLYQNTPNPFNKSTLIHYSIPLHVNKSAIIVTDLKGIKLEEFNLSNNVKGFLTIDANRLPAGTYIYALIVDGRLVDSKKMVLTH
jgi:hypothetical protein